jgi:hypothetical protein
MHARKWMMQDLFFLRVWTSLNGISGKFARNYLFKKYFVYKTDGPKGYRFVSSFLTNEVTCNSIKNRTFVQICLIFRRLLQKKKNYMIFHYRNFFGYAIRNIYQINSYSQPVIGNNVQLYFLTIDISFLLHHFFF